jgi:pilus assembly protein Flp/PilA
MKEQDVSMSRSQTMRSLRDFLSNDSGATAIEYAMIASGVAGAIIVVVMGLGTTLQAKYQSISDALH